MSRHINALFADVFAKNLFVGTGFLDSAQTLVEIVPDPCRNESDDEGRPTPENGVVIENLRALPVHLDPITENVSVDHGDIDPALKKQQDLLEKAKV